MIERRHAPVLAGLAKSISEGGGKSPEELELAVRMGLTRPDGHLVAVVGMVMV